MLEPGQRKGWRGKRWYWQIVEGENEADICGRVKGRKGWGRGVEKGEGRGEIDGKEVGKGRGGKIDRSWKEYSDWMLGEEIGN